MKIIVLIFLISGAILAQSTQISKNINERSPLESIKKDSTQISTTKDDKTKVKESKVEVSKLDELKLESSKDLNKDELKLKKWSKLKGELKAKDDLKGNKLKLKNGLELKDLKLEEASDSKPVERAKKDCQTVPGPITSPTKICFEVTPGVQGPLEICKEGVPGFANSLQIPQESQPGPQLPQEPQFIPEPHQINFETPQPGFQYPQSDFQFPQSDFQFPQPDFQVPQLNYQSQQLPIFYKGPSLTPAQIPTVWCIQTETGTQSFPSIIQIEPQHPQGSVYQAQPQQQIWYSPNFPPHFPPSSFPNYPILPSPPPQNLPSHFPPSSFPNYPTLPALPPQNLPSHFPPSDFPNYPTLPSFSPQNLPSNYPPQPFPYPPPHTFPFPPLPPPPPQSIPHRPPQKLPYEYSQNRPPVYSQNSPPAIQIQLQTPQVQSQQQFGYPQNMPYSFPNFPNKFHSIMFGPSYGTKYEVVKTDSQGFLPAANIPPSTPGSSGGHSQPTGPAPTAEANSQNVQQQTMPINAINLDARRLQPGPLSRILDRPSSFQMSGQTGTMENSWVPLMIQGPRLSREPESGNKQLENDLETEEKFKSQPSRKNDQSTFKISSPSQTQSSSPKSRISASQQLAQSIFPPSGLMGNQNENLQHIEKTNSAQTLDW